MTRTIAGRLLTRMKRELTIAVERTYLYACSSRDRVVAAEVPSGVEIRRIDPTAMSVLGTVGAGDPAAWAARLRRGDACYGAWVSGELAHYSWVQTSGEHVIDSACRTASLVAGTFCIYNCRTAEAYRGMRLYPRTLAAILADQFARGLSEAWIYTTDRNVASQHGILRAGFRQVEELRALRLGRWLRPLGDRGTFARTSATPPRSPGVAGPAWAGH